MRKIKRLNLGSGLWGKGEAAQLFHKLPPSPVGEQGDSPVLAILHLFCNTSHPHGPTLPALGPSQRGPHTGNFTNAPSGVLSRHSQATPLAFMSSGSPHCPVRYFGVLCSLPL